MKRFYYLVFVLSVAGLCSCKKHTLFQQVSSSHSGIHFKNEITESDSVNPLDLVNIYNGGGVGIGDFNKDGLPDIYFTGNMVSNRLYLNKGDFKFEDVTEAAGVTGSGRWGRGVAVVDINNDGMPDIYVCNTLSKDSLKRRNFLYINQGNDKNGTPHFKDQAQEYGLSAGGQSTMASFFDYDNDGDLDVYLTVNSASASYNPGVFGSTNANPNHSRGKLYRNDWDNTLQHAVFTDVSAQAGLTIDGYGHGATTVDFNDDGWKDIYISNDFISSNLLYINNHDGTFTNRSKEYFKHTSYNSMGQDVIDINNDGLADVIELDMNPEDNYRKKMMLGPNSYQTFINFDRYGYQYQYVRNTLQINQGHRLGQEGQIGDPAYSEVGFLSGIAQTDWSWTPLVGDFDNDGYRDIVITNGFPKDVSDRDFMTYREEAYAVASKKKVLEQIPEIKLPNYAFANNGNLTFKDVSKAWGLDISTFSNGAVYADLDNDGALDMVVNNINDEALVYRNTSRDEKDSLGKVHYLQVKLTGDKQNINGLGTQVDIYYDHGKHQAYDNSPYRGYLSTMQDFSHFGLGKVNMVDSVVVKWQDGKKQVLFNVKADQQIKVNIKGANMHYQMQQPQFATQNLFKEVTTAAGINFTNQDGDFIDFNIQKLLPHKLSAYTPSLTVGDVNGDGLDDIIIGGNSYSKSQVFTQQPNGKFIQNEVIAAKDDAQQHFKDAGLLLFDANGDGKLDLYAASGGYENAPNDPAYQDRLYLNDGKGHFTLSTGALPANLTSKLCVRACDYNKDGKLDLLVTGRVEPWSYPKPVSSMILRNDSKDGKAAFTDVTAQVAPALKNIGMVCDALFTDMDNDTWPDLILAGEWMPITFLKNQQGKFVNVTQQTGVGNKLGWWNSLAAGDFRHTGRTDYIVGNVGRNTLFQASDKYPVYITAKDFDKNNSYTAIPSLYLPSQDGSMKEYPAPGRDDILKQMISLKKKYTNYKSYATATMADLFSPEQMESAQKLKANMLQSVYLRNDGNGKFTIIPLPIEAQVSVLNGMVVDDFDGDGNLDVVINGNDFGTDVSIGRYDALNGLMLKGDGKGGFKAQTIMQSGIYIPGDGRALVKLRDAKDNILLAASQNRSKLLLFQLKATAKTISALPDDTYAVIKYKNGTTAKQEFYYGTSFLSQSARFIKKDASMDSITIFNTSGKERVIK
jgi:hypothetical protein